MIARKNHGVWRARWLNDTGWYRRRAELMPIVITERMLMRHGWYRRKLRKEGVWMKPTGPNEVMLTGFAEKHFKTRAELAEQYPNANLR